MSGQKNGPDKNMILMGRIGAAHGLQGEVRIASFTQDPMAIAKYGDLSTSRPELNITIKKSRLAKSKSSSSQQTIIIAKLQNIDTRTQAEGLNGIELFVKKEKLAQNQNQEDEFLHIDLIGLEARLPGGKKAGKVIAVQNFGAADLLEIEQSSKKTILLPFTKAAVPKICLEEGFLEIVPLEEIDGENRKEDKNKGDGSNEL